MGECSLDGGGNFVYEVERRGGVMWVEGVSVEIGDGSSACWVKVWMEEEVG